MRVSAHAGWASRWCGWCACVPLVGRDVVAWLLLVFVSAPLFCQCGGMVDTPASKAGARLGVRVRVPRLVLGGSETVEYECVCARVVDMWYSPSKTFSACGVVKAKLPLSERAFNCASCGASMGRDANKSINVEVAGSAPETLNARGGAVRHSSPSGHVALVPVKREPSGRVKAL